MQLPGISINPEVRKRFIIFIALIVFIAIIIFGAFMLLSKASPEPVLVVNEDGSLNTNSQNQIPPQNRNDGLPQNSPLQNQRPPVSEASKDTPRSSEQKRTDTLFERAKDIAARYGTFSNQNPFDNLKSLEGSVTPRLWESFQAFITASGSSAPANPSQYSGVTSRAYAAEGVDFAEANTRQQVVVSLQRQEIKNGKERTFVQDILITLVSVGGEWKADQIVWQKER